MTNRGNARRGRGRPRLVERHGHLVGYVVDGCRCDACKAAMSVYRRERKAKKL